MEKVPELVRLSLAIHVDELDAEVTLAVAVVVGSTEAESVALPPTAGTLIAGRFARPSVPVTWVVVVAPPLNVYPSLSVTVTLWPAVGTPPTVTVTYAPVIVPHAVPLYVALSNASAVTPEADAIGAMDAAAITGTDHAAPVRIVRRDGADARGAEVAEVSGS